MKNLILFFAFTAAFPTLTNAADQDLSLSCKGATFESTDEKGKKTKHFGPVHMEKTFHIRQRVLQPDMPCKVWTDDRIFCSNGDDTLPMLFELCMPKSNHVTCLKIDRVTGEVYEQYRHEDGNKTTRSGFSGKCTKLTGRKF